MHISFSYTFTLLSVLLFVTAIVAIIDAAARLRGRRGVGVLAVIELIAAILLIVTQFVRISTFLGSDRILEIILGVVLILLLIFRGSVRRGFAGITVIALILDAVLLLISLGWLHIPGFA
jgi:hypothetical protein